MKLKLKLKRFFFVMLAGCVCINGCKCQNVNSSGSHHVNFSSSVPSTLADDLIKTYKQSGVLTTIRNGKSTSLHEFKFSYAQINEIINHNASGITVGDTGQLALYLGYEKGKIWHLIAYGMVWPYDDIHNGGTLLVTAASGAEPSIFDSESSLHKSPDAASDLRTYYYTHTNYLHTLNSKNHKIELDGFSFTAGQINQILKKNPDSVAFAVGVECPLPDKTQKRWHLIAYGRKGGMPIGASISNPPALPASALYFDKADPCPKCVPQ